MKILTEQLLQTLDVREEEHPMVHVLVVLGMWKKHCVNLIYVCYEMVHMPIVAQ